MSSTSIDLSFSFWPTYESPVATNAHPLIGHAGRGEEPAEARQIRRGVPGLFDEPGPRSGRGPGLTVTITLGVPAALVDDLRRFTTLACEGLRVLRIITRRRRRGLLQKARPPPPPGAHKLPVQRLAPEARSTTSKSNFTPAMDDPVGEDGVGVLMPALGPVASLQSRHRFAAVHARVAQIFRDADGVGCTSVAVAAARRAS